MVKFTDIPFEILDNIALYLTLNEILRFRKICRRLRGFSASSKVFGHARRYGAKPYPIPGGEKLMHGWTEAQFVKYIHYGGPCEICHEFTPRMPASLTLRIRLCTKTACYKKLKSSFVDLRKPQFGVARLLFPSLTYIEPHAFKELGENPIHRYHTLIDRLEPLLTEWRENEATMSEEELFAVCKEKAQRWRQWYKDGVNYQVWKNGFYRSAKEVITFNNQKFKERVMELGWKWKQFRSLPFVRDAMVFFVEERRRVKAYEITWVCMCAGPTIAALRLTWPKAQEVNRIHERKRRRIDKDDIELPYD